jgi:hypothetical membrane protein
MLVYPGGTVRDPLASGYSFFRNFLSDLGRKVAFGGRPNNLAAHLSLAGFAIMASALVGCVLRVVGLCSSSRRQRHLVRAAAALGGLAGVCLFGVALAPADRFPAPHLQLASVALGVSPIMCILFGLASASDHRFPKGVVVAWMALAAVVGALFSTRWWGLGIDTDLGLVIGATAQKIGPITALTIVIYLTYQADRVIASDSGAGPNNR